MADIFDNLPPSNNKKDIFDQLPPQRGFAEKAARLKMQADIGILSPEANLLEFPFQLAEKVVPEEEPEEGAVPVRPSHLLQRALGQEPLSAVPYKVASMQTEPETPTEQAVRDLAPWLQLIGAAPSIIKLATQLGTAGFRRIFPDLARRAEQAQASLGKPAALRPEYEEIQENVLPKLQQEPTLAGRTKEGGPKLGIQPPQIEWPPKYEEPAYKITKGKEPLPKAQQEIIRQNAPKEPLKLEKLPVEPYSEKTPIAKPARELPPTEEEALTRETIGEKIAPEEYANEAVGGSYIRENLQKEAEKGREVFKKEYEEAERAYEGKEDTFDQPQGEEGRDLRSQLDKTRRILTDNDKLTIDQLNPAEKKVVSEINQILDILGPEGKPVSLSTMIRKSKSLSSSLKYEELYGDAKTLLKTVVHDINEAVAKSAEKLGLDVEKIVKPNITYSKWAKKYSIDELNDFMKAGEEKNYEKLFNKYISDVGVHRAVNEALGPEYEGLIIRGQRALVNERMKPYMKDLKKVGSYDYAKEIDNLGPILGEEKAREIDLEFRRLKELHHPERTAEQKRFEPIKKREGTPLPKPQPISRIQVQSHKYEKIRKREGPQPPKPQPIGRVEEKQKIKPIKEKEYEDKLHDALLPKNIKGKLPEQKVNQIVEKYTGKTPEQIQSMLSKRSSMKELKEDLYKHTKSNQAFENLLPYRLRRIALEGNLVKEPKGQNFYNVFAKEDNFNILREAVGKEKAEALLKEFEDLKDKEVSRESIRNLYKGGKKLFYAKTFLDLIGFPL